MDNNPQAFTQETNAYQPPAVPIELCPQPSGYTQQDYPQPQMGTPQYSQPGNPVQVQQAVEIQATHVGGKGFFESKKTEKIVLIVLLILGFFFVCPFFCSFFIGVNSSHKKARLMGVASMFLLFFVSVAYMMIFFIVLVSVMLTSTGAV